jgi:hypothetical protein
MNTIHIHMVHIIIHQLQANNIMPNTNLLKYHASMDESLIIWNLFLKIL